jgi:hypothetical protein
MSVNFKKNNRVIQREDNFILHLTRNLQVPIPDRKFGPSLPAYWVAALATWIEKFFLIHQ